MNTIDSFLASRNFTKLGDEVIFDNVKGYKTVMTFAILSLISSILLAGFGLYKNVAIDWPLVFTSFTVCVISTFVANREGRTIVSHDMQLREFSIIKFYVFGIRKDATYRFDAIRVIFSEEYSGEGVNLFFIYIELKNSVKFKAGFMHNKEGAAIQVEKLKDLYAVV